MKIGLVGIVFGVIFPKTKLVHVVAENKEGKPLTSGLPPGSSQSGVNIEAEVVYSKPTSAGELK